jgi:peptidoglycan/LPS O-acetylase OafA/YrhL
MQHLKSLDGIRGIAVLLVMSFHGHYFHAGWIGVQIFFTLSGYLITGILIKDRGASFRDFAGRFYWRRTLRIFPLLYVFLLFVAAVHALCGVPAAFASDWPWLVTFTANFGRMRDQDLGLFFVHLWSLAVEEQFYLIWPLLVYFLPPRAFRWTVVGVLLFAPVVRLALFQGLLGLGYDAQYAGKGAYVLPFTQFDAFAAGAAIPLWGLDRLRHAGRWFLIGVGVAAVAGLYVLIEGYFWGGGAFVGSLGYAMFLIDSYEYVWGYSLINTLSMLGIICALQRVGPARLLENGPLVWAGKVSYGIYVYHLPLLLAGEFLMEWLGIGLRGAVRPAFFAVWVVIVMLVSGASFRWLERPFLKLKDNWFKRDAAQAQRQALI